MELTSLTVDRQILDLLLSTAPRDAMLARYISVRKYVVYVFFRFKKVTLRFLK